LLSFNDVAVSENSQAYMYILLYSIA
jgi:hypothetical protein